MNLGIVQELILEELERAPDRAYGAALQLRISEKIDRHIQIQCIYMALHRLECRRFIRRYDGKPRERGRTPVLYALTEEGRQVRDECRRRRAAFP